MKKIIIIAAAIMMMAAPAIADSTATVYIDEKAEAFHQAESGEWEVLPIQVYVVVGKKKYYDDLTYVEVGHEGRTVEAFIMENGLPGDPNIATRDEREKFVRALKKSKILMMMAEEGDLSHQKSTGRFMNFDLDVLPGSQKSEPRLRVKLINIENRERITLYMDDEQIDGLIPILEKAPAIIAEIKKARKQNKAWPASGR